MKKMQRLAFSLPETRLWLAGLFTIKEGKNAHGFVVLVQRVREEGAEKHTDGVA